MSINQQDGWASFGRWTVTKSPTPHLARNSIVHVQLSGESLMVLDPAGARLGEWAVDDVSFDVHGNDNGVLWLALTGLSIRSAEGRRSRDLRDAIIARQRLNPTRDRTPVVPVLFRAPVPPMHGAPTPPSPTVYAALTSNPSARPVYTAPSSPGYAVLSSNPSTRPEVIQAAFCPQCGTGRLGNLRFCHQCGLDLEGPAIVGASTASRAPTRAAPVIYETIELIDRDTGEMPMRANALSLLVSGPGYIRHYLIGIRRWPGGSEEILIVEHILPGGSLETMHNRSQLQTVIDGVTSELEDDGWEPQPLGAFWFSRTFRRGIAPGETITSMVTDEGVAWSIAEAQKRERRIR